MSLSPLCNGTAGFLGGAAEDFVLRATRHAWPQTSLWLARCPQGGFQEDGKPQLPGSYASWKSGNQKPHLLEAPSGGLVGPGLLRGIPLVPAWSSARAIGWEEETAWSEPLPGISSNMGQLLKIAEATEVWGTEDGGSHRKVRASTSRVFRVHHGWEWGGGPEARVGGGQCKVGTSSSSRAPASSASEDGQAAW